MDRDKKYTIFVFQGFFTQSAPKAANQNQSWGDLSERPGSCARKHAPLPPATATLQNDAWWSTYNEVETKRTVERANAGRASQGKIRCHASLSRPPPASFPNSLWKSARQARRRQGNLPCSVLLPLSAISLNAYSRLSSVRPSVKGPKLRSSRPFSQCYQMAKFDCAPTPSTLAQSKERKVSNFAA